MSIRLLGPAMAAGAPGGMGGRRADVTLAFMGPPAGGGGSSNETLVWSF